MKPCTARSVITRCLLSMATASHPLFYTLLSIFCTIFAAPTGTAYPAVIYPVKGATIQTKQDFITWLDKTLGHGKYIYRDHEELAFATADITPAQNTILTQAKGRLVSGSEPVQDGIRPLAIPGKNDPEAAKVAIDVQNARLTLSLAQIGKRDVVRQPEASEHLVMLSTPPAGTKPVGYQYDSSAGQGITVYMYETGYDTNSPEYEGMANKPRWLFLPSDVEKKMDDVESGHGTCVGSIINGPTYGVAKLVNLVIVKMPPNEALAEALLEVYKDVVARGLQGKAVLNISSGVFQILTTSSKDIHQAMNLLFNEDVIIIAAAGNDLRQDVLNGNIPAEYVNAFPQVRAGDDFPLINVGAVDMDGKNASFSVRGPRVHVMAPGLGVRCASNIRSQKEKVFVGTSFAAPIVTGLAAYLLAEGKYTELNEKGRVAKNMKELLGQLAYSRIEGEGRVAFNGQGTEFSLCRQIRAGARSCFSTRHFVPLEYTTYSFFIEAPENMMVSILVGEGSTNSYHLAKGSWNGIFSGMAESNSPLLICAEGSGRLAVTISKKVEYFPIRPRLNIEVISAHKSVPGDRRWHCYEATDRDQELGPGRYGFGYVTVENMEIEVMLGYEHFDGPIWFSGYGHQGAALMWVTTEGTRPTLCAKNRNDQATTLVVSFTH